MLKLTLISGADQLIKSLDCPSGGKWDLGPMRRIWGLKGICRNGESLVHPTCTIILNNVYFLYQSNKKILKTNINHLKAKKFIICYQNLDFKKTLSSKQSEDKFQTGSSLLLITKFVYLFSLRKSFPWILKNWQYSSRGMRVKPWKVCLKSDSIDKETWS